MMLKRAMVLAKVAALGTGGSKAMRTLRKLLLGKGQSLKSIGGKSTGGMSDFASYFMGEPSKALRKAKPRASRRMYDPEAWWNQ